MPSMQGATSRKIQYTVCDPVHFYFHFDFWRDISFQEFISTLDEPMVRKLCIRSLRRGVGSMDYIHGLLIAEDDLNDVEDDDEEEEATAAVMTQTPISAASHEAGPSAGPSIPWCKCGVCQIMPVGSGNV